MKFLVVLALFAAAAAEPNGYFYGKHNYYNRVLYRGKRNAYASQDEAAPSEAGPARHLGLGKRSAYAAASEAAPAEAAPARHHGLGKRGAYAAPGEAAPAEAAPARHLGLGKREAEPYNWQPGYPGGFPYVATPEIAPYVAAEHYGRKKRAAEAAAKAAPEAAANGAKKAGYGYAAPAAAPVAKYGYGYGYEPTAERADHIYGIQEMGGYHGYLGKREAEDDWAGYHYGDEEMIAHFIGKREADAGWGGAAPSVAERGTRPVAERYGLVGAAAAERSARLGAGHYLGKREANSGGAKAARYGGAAPKAGYGYVYAPAEIRGYVATADERRIRPAAEPYGGRGKRQAERAPVCLDAQCANVCLDCVAGYP